MEMSLAKIACLTTFQTVFIGLIGFVCVTLKVFDKSDVRGLNDLVSVLLMPTYVAVHILIGYSTLSFELIFLAIAATFVQIAVAPYKFSTTKLLFIMVIDSFKKYIEEVSENAGFPAREGYRNAISFLIFSYVTESIIINLIEVHKGKETEDELYQELVDEENPPEQVEQSHTSKIVHRLLAVIDMSFVTLVIALVLGYFKPVRLLFTTDAKILNETVFASTKLMSSTVKIVSIFVFGADIA